MSDLKEIVCLVGKQRDEIVCRLLDFSATDTILYLEDCVDDEQILSRVKRAISFANEILQTQFEEVQGFEVLAKNLAQKEQLQRFLEQLDDASLAMLYLVATELRSVLLGVLFLYHVFSVHEMFNIAFAEELYEQSKWGRDEDTLHRHAQILENLKRWEKFCDERSLFKN